MSILISFVLIAVFLVVPVMFGARMVGARNTGFGSALLAVLVFAVVSTGIGAALSNMYVVFLANAIAGGAIFAGLLGTTFWRGLAISIISSLIQVAIVLVFAGAMLGGSALAS